MTKENETNFKDLNKTPTITPKSNYIFKRNILHESTKLLME